MITFITGLVYSFTSDSVIIYNNGIGYFIYFSHPEKLSLQEKITVFTFQHFREDGTVLYGFLSMDELDLFKKLITVKGLGPKTAMAILSNTTYDQLVNSIENGDVNFTHNRHCCSSCISRIFRNPYDSRNYQPGQYCRNFFVSVAVVRVNSARSRSNKGILL